MNLHRLHRLNAIALSLFIIAHLANHALAPAGAGMHIAFMEVLRSIYRILPVEALLIILFAAQAGLGIGLLVRRHRRGMTWRGGLWARAQVLSGVYLAFFLAQHVGAVVMMRFQWPGVDTNFHWAASVALAWPISLYFLPYYGLAILAIAVHVAAAIRSRLAAPRLAAGLAAGLAASGSMLAVAVTLALGGFLYPIELPAEHRDYISQFYGLEVAQRGPQ